MNDDLGQPRNLPLRQAARGTTHAERGDDAARPVADRRSNAAQAGLVLAVIYGIAARANQPQLALEPSPTGDRGVGEALQAAGNDRVDRRRRLEGENGLAGAGAMDGRRLDQGQRRAALRRYAMGDDSLPPVEHREVDGLAADPAQRVDEGVRL